MPFVLHVKRLTDKQMISKGVWLICLFVLTSQCVFAQTDTLSKDSTGITTLFDYHNAHIQFQKLSRIGNWRDVDTSLNQFYQFNPARKDISFEQIWLGNLGSPVGMRYFTYNRMLGFDYGRHERDPYITDLDELRFWRANVPFTRVSYVTGQYGEQLFTVQHTRNFGPQWNMSIDFNKIASEGYYQRMLNNYTNTALTLSYHTKNERYAIDAAGIRGKNFNQENGGINNDTLFDYPTPNLAEPFREDAFTEWGNWQGRVAQRYAFGKTISYAVNDTTQAEYFSQRMIVSHTFSGTKHNYLFEDDADDISYYGELYYTGDTLRDRTIVSGFSNEIAVQSPYLFKDTSSVTESFFPFRYKAALSQQWHEIADQGGDTVVQNLVVSGLLYFPNLLHHRLAVGVYGGYDIFSNAWHTEARVDLSNGLSPAYVGFRLGKFDPTVMDVRYYGFDRQWDKNWGQTNQLTIMAGVGPKAFNVNASYTQLSNYYFSFYTYAYDPGDESQIVSFAYDDFGITQFNINSDIRMGDFVFQNALGLQQWREVTLNVPTLLVQSNWYFQKHLFKNAMYTQMGVNMWYSSRYSPIPYDMITGRFVQLLGGYLSSIHLDEVTYAPILDVYISADIRTFRFFFKVDNVAQNLFSKGYYLAPNYPIQPRSFKLGLDWSLYQ